MDRHVTKTGDIKDFVIVEESGIAKGIRRIIAVTGHEAQDALRLAKYLEERIQRANGLSRKEKDPTLKELSIVRTSFLPFDLFIYEICAYFSLFKELGQADISVLKKAELRDKLAAIKKAFDKETKEREVILNKAV